MNQLGIGKTIIKKRREKGITQEELANYIGVSKASVSKWETGQSYPDIVLLPEIATYFNITIDELIRYSPQMTKEDIKRLYKRLAKLFSIKPFKDVMQQCDEIIKKYYSCFPLLLQMCVLMLNHYNLAKDSEVQNETLEKIIVICKRIKSESEDVHIIKQANSIEALCQSFLRHPDKILELLEDTIMPYSGDEILLANAYEMFGNMEKAKEIYQVSLYQSLINMFSVSSSYLLFNKDNPEVFQVIFDRMEFIAEVFKVKKLHPNCLAIFYMVSAQGYAIQGNIERSLYSLEKYTEVIKSFEFPIKLHGDDFFEYIDKWIEENLELGSQAPRDEKIIKESFIETVDMNPVFDILREEIRYKNIIKELKER